MIDLNNASTSFPQPEAVYRAIEAGQRATMRNPRKPAYPLAAAAHEAIEGLRRQWNEIDQGESPA